MDVGLLARLEKIGWHWEDNALVAPNGTMWFDKGVAWTGGLRGLREDMSSRLRRIEASVDLDPRAAEDAIADVHQVLRALDDLGDS